VEFYRSTWRYLPEVALLKAAEVICIIYLILYSGTIGADEAFSFCKSCEDNPKNGIIFLQQVALVDLNIWLGTAM
jgi:hypothetical protein